MNEQRGNHRGYDIVASADGVYPGPFKAHFSIWKPECSPPERVYSAELTGDYADLMDAIEAADATAKSCIDRLLEKKQGPRAQGGAIP
jgi:hypothetical protein